MGARSAEPGSAGRRLRVVRIAAIAVAAVAVAAVAVPLVATSTPEYFAKYHLLERRYVNLEGSAHSHIGCRTCHETNAVKNGAALVADFYTSLATAPPMPVYFTFAPPRREACLACHAQDWSADATRTSRIPHPAHQRVASEERDCVTCHKWTAHFESFMPKHKEMPFSGVCVAYGCHVGTKTTDQCFNCHHVLHEDADQWKKMHPKVARAIGENACLERCHKVAQCQECHTTGKTPKFDGLPIEIGMKSIEVLHVGKTWTAKTHGPEALKGQDRCMRCHQSQGECGECHRIRPEFHGSTATWIGRHAKRTGKLNDPACLTCHERSWCEDCHRQFKEMG